MISGSELRRGVIIELDGKLLQVVEYNHIKMKRTALARVKMRDINAGHIFERTFQSDDKLVRVRLDSSQMQYLYSDGDMHYFMDEETFEQTPLTPAQLGDALNYITEGTSVEVTKYKDEIIGVEMPITVELKVTESEPGFKGDTATGGTKPVKVETGLSVNVPLFIKEGDVLKIDTRNGEYLERKN
ncbi:elongation factor P [Chloroflexota bacterium]